MDTFAPQADLLKAISHPTRLAVLEILRDGEQCVCHMEAILGLRQASISQQLMILRQAGLVEVRRDGLNMYYRVVKPAFFSCWMPSIRPRENPGHDWFTSTGKGRTAAPAPSATLKQARNW